MISRCLFILNLYTHQPFSTASFMLKIYHFTIALLFITISSCQVQIPENEGFADDQFRPTENRGEASYYRIYEPLDSPGALSINPNYTDLSFGSDGYGGFFNSPSNDFETSVISFYNFKNELVLKGTGTTSRMLQTFILEGPAVWYEDGIVVKRGFFVQNKVTGLLSFLDKEGNVIEKKNMLGGKEYTPNIHKRLLGHWVCNHPRIKGNPFNDDIDENLALHNEFTNEGTVGIWTEVKEFLYEGYENTIIKSYNYVSYEKESEKKGILVTYDNNSEIVAKEQIEFLDDNTFNSVAVEHPNSDEIGKVYKFVRL